MSSSLCPRCNTPRLGTGRYCPSCAYDYWSAAAGSTQATPLPPPPPATAPPPPPPAPASSRSPGWNAGGAPPQAGTRAGWWSRQSTGRKAAIIIVAVLILAAIGNAAGKGTDGVAADPSGTARASASPKQTSVPTAVPVPLLTAGSTASCNSYIAASSADQLAWATVNMAAYAPTLDPALLPRFAASLATECILSDSTSALTTASDLAGDPRFAKPTPTPAPTPPPTPKAYVQLTAREWAQLVKTPDAYLGNAYKVWGCITQFDAATGPDNFRAQASYANQTYWYSDADNVLFTGDEAALAEFVKDDVVSMNVVSLGSFSYDTQIGGNTTVPFFEVEGITRQGSCE